MKPVRRRPASMDSTIAPSPSSGRGERSPTYVVAEGDMVAVRYTATGTFTGEIPNFKPTGKRFKITDAIFHRFEGGKQVEAWTYTDQLSRLRQFGAPLPKE